MTAVTGALLTSEIRVDSAFGLEASFGRVEESFRCRSDKSWIPRNIVAPSVDNIDKCFAALFE